MPSESHSKTRPRCSKPALERRLRSLCLSGSLDQPRNTTQLRLAACLDHQCTRLSGYGDRSHEDKIVAVPQRDFRLRDRTGRLHSGTGFAGQCSLLCFQAGRVDQTAVGWNVISGFHLNEISRHQFTSGNRLKDAIADHAGRQHGEFSERRQRALGLVFLDETDDPIQQHNGHDGRRIHPVLKQA